MDEIDLLQNELDLHLKTLKKVDESIKQLNVTDKDFNDDDTSKSKRIVLLNSNGTNERHKRDLSAGEPTNSESKLKSRKFSEETPRKLKRELDSGSDEESHASRKIIKSSVVASNMPIKRREDLIKMQNKFNGAEQRNKRIVGVILGTLRQFKNEDTERSSTTQAISRKELEKKIEIKKVEEKKKILEEKKKLEEERSFALNKIRILEQKISLTKEFSQWKNNQLQYKKFIRTKTKPFIFYLPKVLDTKSSTLLEETSVQIDEQIAKKLKITEDEIKKLQQEEQEEDEKMNKNKEENKENDKKIEINNSSSNKNKNDDESLSESEMDEEKNTIVRIGDEVDDEDEPTNGTKHTEETPKEEADDLKENTESNNMETNVDTQ